MISPEQLDQLLQVMVKHGCSALRHGDLEIHTSPGGAVVAQQPTLPPIVNPYASVSTLADVDSLYGVPSITKDGE